MDALLGNDFMSLIYGVGGLAILWLIFSGTVEFTTDLVKTALRWLAVKTPLPSFIGVQGSASLIVAVFVSFAFATNFDVGLLANNVEIFADLNIPDDLLQVFTGLLGAWGARRIHMNYGEPITILSDPPETVPPPPVP